MSDVFLFYFKKNKGFFCVMKKFLTLLLLAAAWCAVGGTFTVDPANAVIAVDPKGCPVARLAASELQYFVEMMTGKKIAIVPKAVPGKYLFLFEKPAGVKLKPGNRRALCYVHNSRIYLKARKRL